MEYIPCYSARAVHWGLLPGTKKILTEQNIKRRTGPALSVLASWIRTLPALKCTVNNLLGSVVHI
jgi:hypothetical protein